MRVCRGGPLINHRIRAIDSPDGKRLGITGAWHAVSRRHPALFIRWISGIDVNAFADSQIRDFELIFFIRPFRPSPAGVPQKLDRRSPIIERFLGRHIPVEGEREKERDVNRFCTYRSSRSYSLMPSFICFERLYCYANALTRRQQAGSLHEPETRSGDESLCLTRKIEIID